MNNLLISENTLIIDAFNKIQSNSMQILFVINANNEVIGTLTDGDLRQAIINKLDLNTEVKMIFNKNFIFASGELSRIKLIELMKENGIRQIPILDSKRELQEVVFLDQLLDSRNNQTPVVLMAGGYGSRLGSLTLETPKPLLNFGKMTFLEWQLNKLHSLGFANIYLSVRYLSRKFYEFLESGQFDSLNIQIVEEVEEMGTAGSLGSIRRNILQNNNHILVINADVISNLNYLSAIKFHQKCQSDFTIVSKEVTTTIPYGVLKIEEDKVTRIIEKPNFNNFINIGIYVINGEVLDLIPVNSGFNMDSLINKAVSKSYTVKLFNYSGEWVDVGHPSEYIEVQNKFDTFKIF
jgi:dTDP-glucose pyrophosphorylase